MAKLFSRRPPIREAGKNRKSLRLPIFPFPIFPGKWGEMFPIFPIFPLILAAERNVNFPAQLIHRGEA